MTGPAGASDLAPVPSVAAYLARYDASLLGVFGAPQTVLTHGEGCWVVDADGRRYLDLLAGIAVNTLGHGHAKLAAAISDQARQLVHISNFFTSPAQIALAERLLSIADAPAGSAVFFANSGAEAVEAALKLTRRTGRSQVVAATGAFHGRTTGALALTAAQAYRAPFEPLLPGVRHIPFNDVAALREAVDETVAAVVLEPIQGEAGVIPADVAYLRAAREATSAHGALLVLDEVQCGVGRTGSWFAHTAAGISPDAMTLAKGLAGGVPIGALVTFGADVTGLLTTGQHGSTFGGNPLACAAGLAVLDTVEADGLLRHATVAGEHLREAVLGLGHPLVSEVRGRGLLRGIGLRAPIAPAVVSFARAAGFIVNAPNAGTVRLAPPLIISTAELDLFIAALPQILARAEGEA